MREQIRLGVIVPSVNLVVEEWYPRVVPKASVHRQPHRGLHLERRATNHGNRDGFRRLKAAPDAARKASQQNGRAGSGARLSTAISTRCPPHAGQMSSDRPKSRE